MTNVSPQDGAGSTGDPCSPLTAPPHVPPSLASYEAQALCSVLRCKKEEAPPDVWQGHLEGKALGGPDRRLRCEGGRTGFAAELHPLNWIPKPQQLRM